SGRWCRRCGGGAGSPRRPAPSGRSSRRVVAAVACPDVYLWPLRRNGHAVSRRCPVTAGPVVLVRRCCPVTVVAVVVGWMVAAVALTAGEPTDPARPIVAGVLTALPRTGCVGVGAGGVGEGAPAGGWWWPGLAVAPPAVLGVVPACPLGGGAAGFAPR